MTGPRFSFRLQQVLDLRERAEQAAATRVAAAAERAQRARDAHAALAAVRTAGAQEIEKAHAHAPTVGQLSNLAFVLDRIDQQLAASEGQVQAADAGMHAAQQDLTVAFQARHVIDRLREKHHDEWRTEATQTDRRLMDELALARFTKRAAGDASEDVK